MLLITKTSHYSAPQLITIFISRKAFSLSCCAKAKFKWENFSFLPFSMPSERFSHNHFSVSVASELSGCWDVKLKTLADYKSFTQGIGYKINELLKLYEKLLNVDIKLIVNFRWKITIVCSESIKCNCAWLKQHEIFKDISAKKPQIDIDYVQIIHSNASVPCARIVNIKKCFVFLFFHIHPQRENLLLSITETTCDNTQKWYGEPLISTSRNLKINKKEAQRKKFSSPQCREMIKFRRNCEKGSIIKCLILSPLPTYNQYGFVNYALELLVLKNFGLEIWEKIKWVLIKKMYL